MPDEIRGQQTITGFIPLLRRPLFRLLAIIWPPGWCWQRYWSAAFCC
jgi:hypothetical protein